ncbi:MAG: PLP-dependent aminotransferase family protein [Desulfovibrionaceae bacterium]|nr:PLP-dependent aminotransferase family protein [Desulfovibrionaceae bacterium]
MKLLDLYLPSSPKYLAVADAVERGIASGLLGPGEALPTQRELAEALDVTVGTITRAYAESARRGLTVGITGKGTFVAETRPDVDIPTGDPAPASPPARKNSTAGPAGDSAVLNLGFIAPFEWLNPSLSEALARLTKAEARDLRELQRYQRPGGLPRHRAAGARWARRYGVAVSPDDLIICAGSQHALLTILTSLCKPGDRIATEMLGYPLLRQLARRLRLHVTPIRADESGMLPDALDAACHSGGMAAVYLMPTCRNPTTGTVPAARRHELVDICRRHGVLIIEDDVFALSLLPQADDPEIPSFAALAPERTCLIAATSEILGGGLRVAYLCPPQHLLPDLEQTIAYTISMVPPLMAELAALWIDNGTADHVLAAKRAEAAARNSLARSTLDGFGLESRDTGFFCWLRLPRPWTGTDFADAARRLGVLVAEGEHFLMGHNTPEHGVRLALGGVEDRGQLGSALRALAALLHGTPQGR